MNLHFCSGRIYSQKIRKFKGSLCTFSQLIHMQDVWFGPANSGLLSGCVLLFPCTETSQRVLKHNFAIV